MASSASTGCARGNRARYGAPRAHRATARLHALRVRSLGPAKPCSRLTRKPRATREQKALTAIAVSRLRHAGKRGPSRHSASEQAEGLRPGRQQRRLEGQRPPRGSRGYRGRDATAARSARAALWPALPIGAARSAGRLLGAPEGRRTCQARWLPAVTLLQRQPGPAALRAALQGRDPPRVKHCRRCGCRTEPKLGTPGRSWRAFGDFGDWVPRAPASHAYPQRQASADLWS